MTVQTGFVRDLQDNPGDETVRLIFCDWLADQGEPDQQMRRRLLQIQCELALWVPEAERRRQLHDEERELIVQHSAAWLGDLTTFTRQVQFQAGLVDATFETTAFLSRRFAEAADDLFDHAWIGRVRLESPRGSPQSLRTSAALGRVRQLDLSSTGLDDTALAAFLANPAAEQFVALNLANNTLTDQVIGNLTAGTLTRLRELDLRNNRLSPQGIQRLLAAAARLPELRRLEVHGNPVPVSTLLDVHAFREGRDGIPRRDGLPMRVINSVGMEFALIHAGTFLMGSPESEPDRGACEGPLHEIELTQPYYVSVNPVTQRQYLAVTGSNPAHFTSENQGGLDHPVEMVTWGNASAFCEQLTQRDAEILQGRFYRLPTEAQWEHACRAGTTTPFHFGVSGSSLQANFDGRQPYGGARQGPSLGRTTPVGSYPPNGFGLFDLHGNVWEWCGDYYDERYYARSARRDPTGPRSGNRVSARGGSWSSLVAICRSASRDYWYGPHYCRDNIGFRVVLAVPTSNPTR